MNKSARPFYLEGMLSGVLVVSTTAGGVLLVDGVVLFVDVSAGDPAGIVIVSETSVVSSVVLLLQEMLHKENSVIATPVIMFLFIMFQFLR